MASTAGKWTASGQAGSPTSSSAPASSEGEIMRRWCWCLLLVGPFCLTAAGADLKLGYIDSEALREKLPDFRAAQSQLERLHQQYEGEATERKNKLDKLEEDFHKQELLISEARRAELKAQLDEQKKQLQDVTQKTFGADGELMKKNVELSGPIFEKINAAIQELAKEDGYDFIFDVAAANSAIVFAQERYDLTEKLLNRMKEADKDKQKEGAR
ncbi:MAG: OmpH family outer membrane protein [Candidatus Latescibacteria bacterium]|nr:OmpH family outer membrane protein [Candidatus Latescibacterota bacterium]